MFVVHVKTKKGTSVNELYWDKPQCTLGKGRDVDVNLRGWKVAKNHAVVHQQDDGFHVKKGNDSQSINVNGNETASFGPLANSDRIVIGDYIISIETKEAESAVAQQAVSQSSVRSDPVASKQNEQALEPIKLGEAHSGDQATNNLNPSSSPETANTDQDLLRIWRSKIHQDVLLLFDLRRLRVNEMDDDTLRVKTAEIIEDAINASKDFPDNLDRKELSEQVLAEAVGLGPLEKLIAREDISEIMVNAHDEIFYEQDGNLMKSDVVFTDDNAVISAIERIVSPLGRRIDEGSPMVDARLKDGSRVNAVIPPLALKGPNITIRKFMKRRLGSKDLIKFQSINEAMVNFVETSVLRKRNIVISGGTGSGKTTLLNVMSNYIPDKERIITVEDAAELQLYQPNLISLEARPPNQEGTGAVTIRDLVKNCLRMRPDRIVVGECRGGEALDMLQAMNTGHDGSLTTVHANSPRDCLSRLEVLVLMSGMELPVRAIREQIASAVNMIVQQTRFSCGSRRVTSITEVTGVEGETIQTSEIFRFRQTGFDENGKTIGFFEPTGMVPEFYEELRQRGIEVDMSVFENI